MSSSLQKFLKSIAVYGVGTILPKLIGVILLPIYTHTIQPEAFGYFDMSVVAIALITSIVYFNIWTSTLRFMYRKSLDKYQVAKASIYIFLASSLVLLAGAQIVSAFIDIAYLLSIVIYGIAISISQLAGFIARGNGDSKGFVYGGAINSLVTGALSVGLLLIFHLDILALYIGATVGGISQLAFTFSRKGLFRKVLSAKPGLSLSKQLFIYSFPLILNTAGMWFIQSYGRYVVGQESLVENGLYAVAFKLAAIVALVATIFNFVWQDTLFSKDHTSIKDRNKFYSKGGSLYARLLASGTAVTLPALYLISPLLIAEEYRAGVGYIPLLVLVAAIGSYAGYLGSVFYALLKTKIIFYSTLIPGLLCIPLVPSMTSIWGPNGASIAALIGIILSVVIRQSTLWKIASYSPFVAKDCLLLFWILATCALFYANSVYISVAALIINVIISLIIFQEIASTILRSARKKIL